MRLSRAMRFSRYRAAYSSSREAQAPRSTMSLLGFCVIEGLPNNRPGFGRVLNHDGSSFPHGRCHGHGFWDRSSIIRCKVAFFLLRPRHISFLGGGKYLNVAIRRHSSAPPGGLGDEKLGLGCGDTCMRDPRQLSLLSTMTATS